MHRGWGRFRGWGLAILLVAPPAGALGDAEVLFCAQVHAEAARVFAAAASDEARLLAADAERAATALGERDLDLLNEFPDRHARARTEAQRRLAALPAVAPARERALRDAHDRCRQVVAGEAPQSRVRAEMLGMRRFCRDLMLRTGQRGKVLRATFTDTQRAALDELLQAADALARPLPGAPVTPDEDREARQWQQQRRAELDTAIAAWKRGADDPTVTALNQCHEAYAKGALGPTPDGNGGSAAPALDAAASSVAADVTAAAAIDLGEILHVREFARGGNYEGMWRRRPADGQYEAWWVHVPTGQVIRDEIAVEGVVAGELRLRRREADGHYVAPVRADGTLGTGSASWASRAAFRWQPLPAQDIRVAGGALGPVLHVRELAPGGEVDGIWRRRGRSNVYDALWLHVPSGEVARDVVVVTGVQRGYVELQRPGRRTTYRAPLQAGGRVSGGWVIGPGGQAHDWVVLPAQSVRLPAPSPP